MSSGMWNRTLIYLGLKEEPDEDYDGGAEQFVPEDDPHAEHATPRPSRARTEPGAAGSSAQPHPARVREPDEGTVRPLRGPISTGDVHVRAVPSVQSARAAVVELSGFDDVPAVGARYRTGQAVLFDLSRASAADARRIVDFVSGLTYALRGRLTKVGARAFLLVPEGVHLPAEERRRLSDLGYRINASAEG
ncbi:cell division protein SepF [Egicoccus sp. AB-alg6-2]|uniref:cell division protein SepF n=1 Tax=Egicoccus sp. AB-alg6-2 TaxID=3242692 RepID=UPI00359DFFBB